MTPALANPTGQLQQGWHDDRAATIAGVSLSHPGFTKVALELSKEGAAKLGIS